MPTEQKKQKVSELKEKVKSSKAIYFSNYKGLTVSKMEKIRKSLKKTTSDYLITKNTLLKIALKENNQSLQEDLQGPTATLFAYDDEIEPLKVLVAFAKENDNLPEIKTGFLGNKVLSFKELEKLAQLPSKNILIAQNIMTIKSPITKLVYNLNYPVVSVINILNNIKNKKEEK